MPSSSKSSSTALSLRLEDDTLKELGTLAAFQERTVASLIRLAVKDFITAQQRKAYPLTVSTALSLGELLELNAQHLVDNSFYLGDTPAKFNTTPGIYLMLHPDSQELYVGSTNDISRRMVEHFTRLENGSHKNKVMRSWSTGWTVVVVLETVENGNPDTLLDVLRRREQNALDKLKGGEWRVINNATAHNLVSEHKARPQRQTSVNLLTGAGNDVSNQKLEELEPSYRVNTTYSAGDGEAAFRAVYIPEVVLPILEDTQSPYELTKAIEAVKNLDEYNWLINYLTQETYHPWIETAYFRGSLPVLKWFFEGEAVIL